MITLEHVVYVIPVLGLAASIFYYAGVLRNANRTQEMQLETRQAQLFMPIYDKWSGEELSRAWRITRNIQFNNYDDFETFWKNRDPENEEWFSAAKIGGFYEGVGVLVKEKLIDIRLIALLMKGRTTAYFEMMKPYIERYREQTGAVELLIETEYLYNELMRYIEENLDYRTQQQP